MVKSIKIFWPNINVINSVSKDDFIIKFSEVFSDRTIKLELNRTIKCLAALRYSLDLELDRLICEGITK